MNLHLEDIWKNYLLQLALMINSGMEYFHTLIICFIKALALPADPNVPSLG